MQFFFFWLDSEAFHRPYLFDNASDILADVTQALCQGPSQHLTESSTFPTLPPSVFQQHSPTVQG